MTAPILWIFVGVIYCVYMLARDATGGSSLGGFLALLAVVFVLAILWVLYTLDAGWAILPLICITVPIIAKIDSGNGICEANEKVYYEWLEQNEPVLTRDVSNLSDSEQRVYYIRVSKIRQKMEEHQKLLDYVPLANKMCNVGIPIGWGLLPITYCAVEKISMHDTWVYAFVGLPLVIAAMYVKLYLSNKE